MSLDLAALRADTPGCAHVLHLNNAGAALMPRPVHEAVVGHLTRELETGGYEAAAEADAALRDTYAAVADLLNASPDEIALVDNATRAWDMAFYGIPFRPGDRVLTSRVEYGANYVAYLQMTKRLGIRVTVLPDDPATGSVDLTALEAELTAGGVRLVSLPHVPTGCGVVAPAAAIGRLAKAHGALFLLDACQSAGHLALDVAALGCDFLSATGRKYLRGPRGTGFLYCRREVLAQIEPPTIDHHAATWTGPDSYALAPTAQRFEVWESSIAGRIGLGVAVRYALRLGLPIIEARIRSLAARLRDGLAAVPGVTVRDGGSDLGGLVTFTVDGQAPQAVQAALRARAVNVSVSSVGSSLLDFSARRLTSVLRASVHYYNSEEELDRFLDHLRAVTGQ